MLTLVEHNAARAAAHKAQALDENSAGVACPECGVTMAFASLLLLETVPRVAPVACPRCGYTGEMVL